MCYRNGIYCLQEFPCIFQPGHFTGWGSEGVKQCYVADFRCDAQLHLNGCTGTQAQPDRLAASSVRQRVGSGLVETNKTRIYCPHFQWK